MTAAVRDEIFVTVHGCRDLFWLPVEQYRRDGRIVRGFQRGAQSFMTCTAMSTLELTNRVVQTIQVTTSCSCLSICAHCNCSCKHTSAGCALTSEMRTTGQSILAKTTLKPIAMGPPSNTMFLVFPRSLHLKLDVDPFSRFCTSSTTIVHISCIQCSIETALMSM